MKRFLAAIALAALLACASAESHGDHDEHDHEPKTHDVVPIRETTNIWGLMPYPDVTVTVGTKVIFRVPMGFHDIATVPTRQEMDDCDMSNPTIIMNTAGEIQPGFTDSTTVTEEAPFYVFTWTPEAAGDYYMVCTIGNGKHCMAGQKFQATVTDGAAGEDVTVMGSDVPFWTVVVEYAPMTITIGDSVRFVSDNQGYHDVVLLEDTCSASTDWDCCGSMQNNVAKTIADHEKAELYSNSDFMANTTFIWTPNTTGVHSIVCEVGAHCEFGQRITINVTEDMHDHDMDSGASATTLLASTLAALAAFLAMAF